MGFYVDSPADAKFAGIFPIDVAPPTIVQGVSLGLVGFVGQFAWGPVQSVYTPVDGPDLLNTFEPAGSPRSSAGYRALKGRKNLSVRMVRVLGSTAAASTATIAGTAGDVNAVAKYKGTLGNAITITIAAAASGVTTQRDLTVSLTDPVTGTTSEHYPSVPLPVGGVGVTVDVTKSLLLASLTVDGAMSAWPANGTTTMSAGSNGSALASTDYVGTQGGTDKGCALFEAFDDVRVVCHDDCGNSIRAATNAGFGLHADYMGERRAIVDGNPDVADWPTATAELTGSLIDERVIFVQSWAGVYDDGGVLQTTPWSTFIASVITNLGPQFSHAWGDKTCTDYYKAAQSIIANFAVTAPGVKADAFALGICLPKPRAGGVIQMQHDRNANAADPARRYVTRGRIEDFLALSIVDALPSYENGPITDDRVKEQVVLINDFMRRQLRAGIVTAFAIDTKSVNNSSTTALGQQFFSIQATSPAPQEQTFLLLQVGPTVQVTTGPQS